MRPSAIVGTSGRAARILVVEGLAKSGSVFIAAVISTSITAIPVSETATATLVTRLDIELRSRRHGLTLCIDEMSIPAASRPIGAEVGPWYRECGGPARGAPVLCRISSTVISRSTAAKTKVCPVGRPSSHADPLDALARRP